MRVRMIAVTGVFFFSVIVPTYAQSTRIEPGHVYVLKEIPPVFWSQAVSGDFVACGKYFLQYKEAGSDDPLIIFSGLMGLFTPEFAAEGDRQVYIELRALKFLSELDVVVDDTAKIPTASYSNDQRKNARIRLSGLELKISPCLQHLVPA